MFSKLLFAALVVPLVSALRLNPLANATSGQQATVTWDTVSSDPTFSLFLGHPSFNEFFGIANNVQPDLKSLVLIIPTVSIYGPGYYLLATSINNTADVYAQSTPFSIGATSSVSLSSVSLSSTATSPGVSLRTTTTTSQTPVIIKPSSTTLNAGLGTTTDSSSPIPTAFSTSAVSRQLDLKVGGIVAAVLTIGSAVMLAL